jgi:hypothetical protein
MTTPTWQGTSSQMLDEFGRDAHFALRTFFPELADTGRWPPGADPAGVREFRNFLERRLSTMPTAARIEGEALASAITRFLLTGEADMASIAAGGGTPLSPEAAKRAAAVLNQHFILPYERELTGHGVQRTFRFWTNEEKVAYVAYCKAIVSALTERFPNSCFAYGTVLALVREKADFLPHDDDIDVLVAVDKSEVPTITAGLEAVSTELSKRGYCIRGAHDTPAHRWVWQENEPMVDVFVGVIEDGTVSSFPGPRNGVAVSDLFPPIMADVLGVKCPVPRNPWRYVETVYGPDWRLEQPLWSHRATYEDYEGLF